MTNTVITALSGCKVKSSRPDLATRKPRGVCVCMFEHTYAMHTHAEAGEGHSVLPVSKCVPLSLSIFCLKTTWSPLASWPVSPGVPQSLPPNVGVTGSGGHLAFV